MTSSPVLQLSCSEIFSIQCFVSKICLRLCQHGFDGFQETYQLVLELINFQEIMKANIFISGILSPFQQEKEFWISSFEKFSYTTVFCSSLALPFYFSMCFILMVPKCLFEDFASLYTLYTCTKIVNT